eukprot:IDg2778t1
MASLDWMASRDATAVEEITTTGLVEDTPPTGTSRIRQERLNFSASAGPNRSVLWKNVTSKHVKEAHIFLMD